MNNIIYIIPGLGENCNLFRYKRLKIACEAKGYKVKSVNPDWYQPVSELVFKVEKRAAVIGFSTGAVIAYLIAKKFPYRKAIFASLSPVETFTFEDYKNDLLTHMPEGNATRLAKDIKNIKVSLKSLNIPYVTLAGEKEELEAKIFVPRNGHRITDTYIKCIMEQL